MRDAPAAHCSRPGRTNEQRPLHVTSSGAPICTWSDRWRACRRRCRAGEAAQRATRGRAVWVSNTCFLMFVCILHLC